MAKAGKPGDVTARLKEPKGDKKGGVVVSVQTATGKVLMKFPLVSCYSLF